MCSHWRAVTPRFLRSLRWSFALTHSTFRYSRRIESGTPSRRASAIERRYASSSVGLSTYPWVMSQSSRPASR